MKFWMFSFAAAVAGSAMGQTIQEVQRPASASSHSYDYLYSRSHEVTYSGTVSGKVKGVTATGASSMMITLKTQKGKQLQVDLGPAWYVAAQTARLNIGDRVKVTGEPIKLQSSPSDIERIVIARLIRRGHQVLALRDPAGLPYWSATRQGRVAVDGAPNSITGKYLGQSDVNVNNEKQIGYRLQTADGIVNVAVAPNWYLEQQGLGFHVGDDVTVYTGVGPAHVGPNLIVADGLYGEGYGTVVLRPNGIPVWNGWTNRSGY